MPEPTIAAVDNSATTTPQEKETDAPTDQYDQEVLDAMGSGAPDVGGDDDASRSSHDDSARDNAQQSHDDTQSSSDNTGDVNADTDNGGDADAQTPNDGTDEHGAQQALGRLDKRLVNLALTNAAFLDTDIDEQELQQRLQEMSFDEKKEVLTELLESNRELRGDDAPNESDLEALADARAEELIIEREMEEVKQAWHTKLNSILNEHPELGEDSKDYNPTLAKALELAVLDGTDAEGNPMPRYGVDPQKAYEAITAAHAQAAENAQKQAVQNRSRALSGAMSGATSSTGAQSGALTWNDMARIQQEDPERYEKIIESGDLPTG